MAQQFTPDYEPPHVSEFIQEEMDARGWSRQDVYERLGYDKTDCCVFDLRMDVRDKSLLMDRREAQALADVFSVDGDLFYRLHESWRTHPATQALPESNVVPMTRGE